MPPDCRTVELAAATLRMAASPMAPPRRYVVEINPDTVPDSALDVPCAAAMNEVACAMPHPSDHRMDGPRNSDAKLSSDPIRVLQSRPTAESIKPALSERRRPTFAISI